MKKLLFGLIILIVFNTGYAQVETKTYAKGEAFSKEKFLQSHQLPNKKFELPLFDAHKMLNEDELNEGKDVPFRFGKGFDTNLSLKDGEWTEVENGRLWSMGFHSKDAYSINFVFNNFYLSDSASLYIVNADGTMLYGPVTSKQNTSNGFFLTDLVQGDNVIIYLFEPNTSKKKSSLSITRIVHSYKNTLPELYGNLGGSWSCNNDIACYPAWATESDAVALVLLASGAEWCSGSLLMTANQDFRSFFLSAFHCIDVSPDEILSSSEITDAQSWLFKFQYKKTTCNGSGATTGITFNGAQFRSAWHDADFVLMEINTSLVADTRFSWLGWDRTGNTPTSGIGIHHPVGDVMKISFDNNSLVPNSSIIDWGSNRFSPVNTHWVVGFDNGTTQGGSSGSPLFDQNKRVIGQLHGGQSSCAPVTKYYGQFNRSWTGGLTNTTRLSNWLDPCNVGIFTTNTSRSPYLSDGTNVCTSGTTFTVNQVPQSYVVTWNCSSNITFDNQTGNPKIFTAIGSGTGTITATLTAPNCGVIVLPTRTVVVGGPPSAVVTNSFSNLLDMGYSNYYKILPASGTYAYEGTLTASSVGATNDSWSYVSGITGKNIAYWSASGSTVDVGAKTNNAGEVLRYTATNGCGSSSANYTFFTGKIGPPPPPPLIITPNPAATQVEVSIPDNPAVADVQTSLAIQSAYTVSIINSYGLTVYSATASGKNVTIPTSNLQNGIYIVRVTDGTTVYQGNLIVNH